MCTVIVLRRPDHPWPLLLAANRDEMRDRPWRPPGRHWPDRPDLVAGLDVTGGGSWLGLNEEGVVACVLDRPGSLGPAPGKRSRGELVLEALDHADARDAAEALQSLSPAAYRPFHLVLADNRDAILLSHDGQRITRQPMPIGLSMITGSGLNMTNDRRQQRFHAQFVAATPPDPANADFSAWQALLAAPGAADSSDPGDGLCFQRSDGYGTGSSAIIALAPMGRPPQERVFLFCDGPPDQGTWRPVLC